MPSPTTTERSLHSRPQIDEKVAAKDKVLERRYALQERLNAAESPGEKIDLAPLQQKLSGAQEANRAVESKKRKAELLEAANAAAAEAQRLTEAMDARKRRVAKAIANAELPVSGLGLDTGMVTYNSKPLAQASDAEQLRISMAIAMALNPKLRVVRVRDGSLLDEDSLAAVAKMADEADCQVWLERVDSSGEIGFVMEDGHLKGQALDDPDVLNVPGGKVDLKTGAMEAEDIDTSNAPEQDDFKTITSPDGTVYDAETGEVIEEPKPEEPSSVDALFNKEES